MPRLSTVEQASRKRKSSMAWVIIPPWATRPPHRLDCRIGGLQGATAAGDLALPSLARAQARTGHRRTVAASPPKGANDTAVGLAYAPERTGSQSDRGGEVGGRSGERMPRGSYHSVGSRRTDLLLSRKARSMPEMFWKIEGEESLHDGDLELGHLRAPQDRPPGCDKFPTVNHRRDPWIATTGRMLYSAGEAARPPTHRAEDPGYESDRALLHGYPGSEGRVP